MPLLPFERYELHSALPAAEAASRLAAAVEPERRFRSGKAARAFEGEVGGAGFRIRRIIGYRNSFLPTIHGRIVPDAGGSRVRCTLTLHPLTAVITALWLAGVVLIGGGIALGPLPPGQSGWSRVAPLGMLLFGWGLVSGAFTLEARRARRLLSELLDAREAGRPT
ncbi:MAG TPA: hypothetical protein VF746_25040 [Longimicrobium sp.]|jgi:hypothetical protein